MNSTLNNLSIPKAQINRNGYVLFRVKKTQVEMMSDRGLDVPKHERDLFLSYDPSNYMNVGEWERIKIPEFVSYYRKIAEKKEENFNTTLSQIYSHPETGIKTIVVYLFRERESSTITSAEFTTKFHQYKNRYSTKGLPLNMVFISEVPVNFTGIKELKLIKTQFFLDEQLLSNPTRHDFYFPHRKLDEEERKQMVEGSGIKVEQLPIISKDDPICRYFDWKEGEIILIHRKQRFLELPAPESIYLRLVKNM